ncbi:MAG: ATP-binding cassette domain-containing protein [Paracoccus sp. (in: a-proteobacteria)]|nr:ATP-binding cassette domain-containing protein [Paracoccus sp. (in: a-proteobacteria)]
MRIRRKPGKGTVIGAVWAASRPGLLAALIFTAVFNLLKFATPLYLLQVLDRVPASRSIETLVMLTIAVLIAVICGIALDVIRRRMLVRWSNWIDAQLSPRILHQGLAEAKLGKDQSEVRRGLDDVGRLRAFAGDSLASWMDVIFAPLFFLAVYLIHPLLGWVALGSLVPLFILSFMADASTRDLRRASSDAGRDAGTILASADSHRESVGGLSMANALAGRWRAANDARLDERNAARGRQVTFASIQRGMSQLLRIAMLAVGVWLYVQGALSLGAIFAGRVLAGFGFTLAEKALGRWRNLREAMTAYRNTRQRLTITELSGVSVLPGVETADVILDQVSFRYPNAWRDIYRRLSLRLGPGEMLLINGPAGAGKSTLSRLFVGTLLPRDGQVRLGDIEIARLPPDLRAGLISYLPQETEIFNGTVRENIARMETGKLTEVVGAARLIGIHDLIVSLPQGYDTLIGPGYSGLSGSQRKRIALARAFYGKPRLIVMDEPIANLDRPARRVFEAALAQRKAEGATIVVTQSIRSERMEAFGDYTLSVGDGKHELTKLEPSEAGAQRGNNRLRRVK